MNINDIYNFYGSISKAAKAIGIADQSIFNWRKKGEIPYNMQLYYEKETNGLLVANKSNESEPYNKGTFPLFRYYDNEFGMGEVDSLTWFHSGIKIIYRCRDDKRRTSFDQSRLMQFLSFLDKNNKLLFEKDIIRIDNEIHTIDSLENFLEYDIKFNNFEIIGNIFEGS